MLLYLNPRTEYSLFRMPRIKIYIMNFWTSVLFIIDTFYNFIKLWFGQFIFHCVYKKFTKNYITNSVSFCRVKLVNRETIRVMTDSCKYHRRSCIIATSILFVKQLFQIIIGQVAFMISFSKFRNS